MMWDCNKEEIFVAVLFPAEQLEQMTQGMEWFKN